jgi:glycosyltransferase XagB
LPVEIGFLVHYDVPPAALAIATQKAGDLGVTADRVLIAQGLVCETQFYRYLARYLRRSFIAGDVALAADVDYRAAIRSGVAPLARGGEPSLLVAPRGRAIGALIAAARQHRQARRFVITTPTNLSRLARAAARVEIAQTASLALQARDASLCARDGMTAPQLLAMTAAASLVAFFAPIAPFETAVTCSLLASFLFLAILWLRLSVCAASPAAPPPWVPISVEADLPVYSIIIALYREARVVPQLLAAIDALVYPRAKLDVKFVLEEADDETLLILRRRAPPYSEILTVPAGRPRTKPRALNAALPLARGDLIAVFDAEDIPDPQQLLRAAARFAVAPARLAGLQARLAIDNSGDGWLAQLFAIEYAGLFEVLNPGLSALGVPFPLSGTSNHFRTRVLHQIGGWDAWNVTEDADIGLRLARFGYDIDTLDSTTFEEAPFTLAAFFGQRRRWCKGWYQTLIVLWRKPRRLARELGVARYAAITLLLGANILGSLAAPLCGLCLALDAALGAAALPVNGWQDGLAGICAMVTVAGVPAQLWPTLEGMRRRRLLRLWPALFLLPLYWLLICAAAWTAVGDLVRQPFHWQRTEHGLARQRNRGSAPGVIDPQNRERNGPRI